MFSVKIKLEFPLFRGGGRGMRWNLKNQKFKIAYFEERNTQHGNGGKLSGKFGFGVFGRAILPPIRMPAQNAI